MSNLVSKKKYLLAIATDKKKLIPLSLKLFGATLFLVLISYFYIDQFLSFSLSGDDLYKFRRFNRHITDIGEAEHFFYLVVIVYFLSLILLRSKKTLSSKTNNLLIYFKNWSANFFLSLLFAGFCIHVFKFLFGRLRPHKTPTFESDIFEPLNTHWHNHSFPSGHSQVLFVVAVHLCLLWPKLSKFILPLAFLLALTRIPTHNHFLSDVLFGSFLGFVCSLWIIYWRREKWSQS